MLKPCIANNNKGTGKKPHVLVIVEELPPCWCYSLAYYEKMRVENGVGHETMPVHNIVLYVPNVSATCKQLGELALAITNTMLQGN